MTTNPARHGWAHRKARAAALAGVLAKGPPYLCARCGKPLPDNPRLWDYAHREDGRPGYLGFTHRTGRCNRGSPHRWGTEGNPWSRSGRARRSKTKVLPTPTPGDRLQARERARLTRLDRPRRSLILPTEVER